MLYCALVTNTSLYGLLILQKQIYLAGAGLQQFKGIQMNTQEFWQKNRYIYTIYFICILKNLKKRHQTTHQAKKPSFLGRVLPFFVGPLAQLIHSILPNQKFYIHELMLNFVLYMSY
jgi:hypothetical protein